MFERVSREDVERALKRWLNEQRRYRGGTFNFGVMGILRIWWHHTAWQTEWVELEAVPIEVLDELHTGE